MEQFNLNGQAVRFFTINQIIYLITSEANKAFGFAGDNTALDNISAPLSRIPISDIFTDATNDGIKNLSDRTLVIELKSLLLAIIRSRKPEMEAMQDIFTQQLAKSFVQNFGMRSEQKALPPATDHERAEKLATATHRRILAFPKTHVDTSEWSTLRELLIDIAKEFTRKGLLQDRNLSYWLSHHLPDVYRAQFGEDPPSVRRKGTRGYCYPAVFRGLTRTYVSSWEATKKP